MAVSPVPAGSARAIVQQLAAQRGWTGAQWTALDKLIQGESGWNPKAANPTSSAPGLFQKMTSVNGPLESTIAGQANWGLGYIASRYGTPVGAYSKWLSRTPHWYSEGSPVFDRGGVATGVGLLAKATTKPERVLSPSQSEAFEVWMRSGARRDSGGDVIVNVTVDPSRGHVRDEVEEVAFQLRKLKRGGHI